LVTDKQVRRLFALIKTEQNQEIAASKAGMDAKTARKYRRHGGLPSELPTAVRGRTRPDPFIDVWNGVQKLFEDNAGLEAKASSWIANSAGGPARPSVGRNRTASHLTPMLRLDSLGQTQLAHYPNAVVVEIKLVPDEAMTGRNGVRMMIVVPSFAASK
jgi:hypothetical protein